MLIRLALIALLSLPGAAFAQTIVDGSSIERIRQIMSDHASNVRIRTDSQGNNYIAATARGWNYEVGFYDCIDNADCLSMQYSARFDTDGSFSTREIMNWHSDWVWGRIRTVEDDVILEMPVYLQYGLTLDNFIAAHDLWLNVMEGFTEDIGWGGSAPSK
ncbi:YbjN domain-containing protein [Pontivivens insulae]|uniref:YbjN domain-containing protein n=1 Tax=Pontivivens insulae TaxID=1639689 RepID=A0A2R8ACV0_9RHOB|nr:YbjN domain-containing protein [Pontivivens insulae]RED14003.1 putative sensory transduction regulator [Pontivivens insulae]SPF30077.1 hypothetical protein POI8812_02407 [Pontivivens insulae]